MTGEVSSEKFVTKMVDNVVEELRSLEVMLANAGLAPVRNLLKSK